MNEEISRAIGRLTVAMAWRWSLSSTVLFAFLVGCMVSLHPYSGLLTLHCMVCDYEAQRHWMEITIQAPNPLSYWGLKYPPLTVHQSWALGLFLHFSILPLLLLFLLEASESSLGNLLYVLLSNALKYDKISIHDSLHDNL